MKRPTIIPAPKRFEDNGFISLGNLCRVSWHVMSDMPECELTEEAKRLIQKAFSEIFASPREKEGGYKIELKLENFDGCKSDEDYLIETDAERAVLTAASPRGIFYAALTFRKLLAADGDRAYISDCKIYDGPTYKHRGMLEETRFDTEFITLNDWYEIIDLYSELKFNELTVAVYGCWDIQYDMKLSQYSYLPLKSTPKLKTLHNIKYYSAKDKKWVLGEDLEPEMYRCDYFAELIRYGKRRNVNVKPLFNSLGHNTLLPKEYPEISAIGEDGNPKGFGMCLSSPETYKRMFAIYDEIIDRYLLPNGIRSIHIGLDEYRSEFNINEKDLTERVSHICHCKNCKEKEYRELIFNYTLTLIKHLKSRGIESVHIYHDMFFGEDYSDKSFVNRVKAEGLYDNVVIEWWDYEPDGENYYRGNRKNVNADLRSILKPMCGYFGWVTLRSKMKNLNAAARLASEIGVEGMDAYAAYDAAFDFDYAYFSEMLWNEYGVRSDIDIFDSYVAAHFDSNEETRNTLLDFLKFLSEPPGYLYTLFEYYVHGYIRPNFSIPRNFPADVFKTVSAEPEKYIPYLKTAIDTASKTLSHLESLPLTHRVAIWLPAVKQYYTVCNAYLTLLNTEKEFNSGLIGAREVSERLGTLIKERDDFILLVENTRHANLKATYLRNTSIFRQYLVDFKDYVDMAVKNGEDITVDLINPAFSGSDIFYYLR